MSLCVNKSGAHCGCNPRDGVLCENARPCDWPEDYAYENGNYMNSCHICGVVFYGYKRRVVCKVCAAKRAASDSPQR